MMVTKELHGTEPRALYTELLFAVACARVDGRSILRFLPEGGEGERCWRMTLRILKNMRRDGRIDFYATSADVAAGTTEGHYLENKYPDCLAPDSDPVPCVYVKL